MTAVQVESKLKQFKARKIGSNGSCAQYQTDSGHVITVCLSGGSYTMQIPPGCGSCKKK